MTSLEKKFEDKYEAYEEKAKKGEMGQHKTVPAKELWRKMLTMLFETGHPWITFKDSCNLEITATTCWRCPLFKSLHRNNTKYKR